MVNNSGVERLVPPLKWAGGKRWFVARHLDLIPKSFSRYFEPFFGSGALYFALRPSRAVLSDLNSELMNVYRVIRDQPALLNRYLRSHQKNHSEPYYYKVRGFAPRSAVSAAARTMYLNRTCWNGLYRVNRRGEFNVPIGTKSAVVLETDDFALLSSQLATATIVDGDFEPVLSQAGRGDFVFVDPPYTVAHNNNGFIKYNERIFSWSDQVRLAACVDAAVKRGAKVLVTNASHASIFELYRGYEVVSVGRAGVIAGRSNARGVYDEVIVKCF
jgi:DNA adenine methylase